MNRKQFSELVKAKLDDQSERYFYDKGYDRLARIFAFDVDSVRLGFALGIRYESQRVSLPLSEGERGEKVIRKKGI